MHPSLMAYINKIEPEHCRSSCDDGEPSYNAAFELDGTVHNKCNRCTLLFIAELAALTNDEMKES